MFFDDRLATVLRQNTQSDTLRRTQYRQLLDLLGAQASGARKAARDPSLVAAAWMRMNKLAEVIPARDRARLINEPGWQLRNPELAAHLADFEPDVALAALSRAQLSSEDWTALIPRLPVRARGFLRLRKDLGPDVEVVLERLGVQDRGLPHPETQAAEVSGESFHMANTHKAKLPSRTADDIDPLPGSDIPPEDLPSAEQVGAPLEPLSDDPSEEEDTIPAPSRPIFFPQDRGQRREETASDVTFDAFTPQPFTKEELWDIAKQPLEEEEANDSDEAYELDAEFETETETETEIEAEKAAETAAEKSAESEANAPPPRPQAQPGAHPGEGRSEISAIVDRIAKFKRDKEEAKEAPSTVDTHGAETDHSEGYQDDGTIMPRLPLGEEDRGRARLVRGFAFAADAAGRIEWAESEVAPMVVGIRLIARSQLQASGLPDALTRAFNRRQMMKAAPVTLHGAPMIAGDWVVDAQPRFSSIGGFAGYIGRMRRKLEVAAEPAPTPAQREADRIRQLLHELRTPVTAVQGYSEVIQQQLFGSAPHEYRALAAAIASDAARILSGFEELDRLAKLETGAIDLDEGVTDITALTKRIIRQLAQVLDARMSGVELVEDKEAALMASIESESAESLMWRMLATLGGGCGAGEMLEATLSENGGMVRLRVDLPMQLLGEDDLFAADARPISTAINPGLFGAGFALRLARAEARAGGGNLLREGESLTLTLPLANAEDGDMSAKEPT
ncbi:HAMP domain-containing histidine kinase [Erythrobacter sp. SCSIO 43205]|uniref:histidine kinase dimerization/phospho-acceptor domain-containing protein n=1 Tax=Erythrobacter sp. SCSIO 43205 TaxID=2779361 RepID=UPI001CA85CE6|nr:histidine kinase dimerization/phospho-acceptor domain-containing protein [Erythrobacter sp. SCSIO 43205]UAB76794.1 HAMP domain-containing histidine kinase [Erythrobacter sp. SCSIO 43205]